MRLFLCLMLICSTFGFSQEQDNCNCCSENHKSFDFWVGDWEVTNTAGKIVGTNSIKKVQGNCVLQENWVGGNGSYTGTSYNFYNQQTGSWEQLWLDNGGGSLHLIGQKEGNQMILKSSTFKNKDGKNTYHQITWTENADGTVRQFWQTFIEGEDTKVAFDGLYSRKN